MNENEFEYEGKTYIAKESDEFNCGGCAFRGKATCLDHPSCCPKIREDGRNVIFVEKKMKKATNGVH